MSDSYSVLEMHLLIPKAKETDIISTHDVWWGGVLPDLLRGDHKEPPNLAIIGGQLALMGTESFQRHSWIRLLESISKLCGWFWQDVHNKSLPLK